MHSLKLHTCHRSKWVTMDKHKLLRFDWETLNASNVSTGAFSQNRCEMQSDLRLRRPNMIEAEKQRGQDLWLFPKRYLMYSGVQLQRTMDICVKNLYSILLDTACKYNSLRIRFNFFYRDKNSCIGLSTTVREKKKQKWASTA